MNAPHCTALHSLAHRTCAFPSYEQMNTQPMTTAGLRAWATQREEALAQEYLATQVGYKVRRTRETREAEPSLALPGTGTWADPPTHPPTHLLISSSPPHLTRTSRGTPRRGASCRRRRGCRASGRAPRTPWRWRACSRRPRRPAWRATRRAWRTGSARRPRWRRPWRRCTSPPSSMCVPACVRASVVWTCGGWMDGWMDGWMGVVMDGWMGGWVVPHVRVCQSH